MIRDEASNEQNGVGGSKERHDGYDGRGIRSQGITGDVREGGTILRGTNFPFAFKTHACLRELTWLVCGLESEFQ